MIKGHRDSKVVARFIKNETKQNQYLKGVVDGKRLGAIGELEKVFEWINERDIEEENEQIIELEEYFKKRLCVLKKKECEELGLR